MDLQHAKREFERYLDGYDRTDDKIRLKIVHTYGVTRCSRQITERMKLSREDQELAQLIGLLHDIGRFEQELYEFMDASHDEILKDIEASGKLSKENEAALRAAIQEFKKKFLAS